MKLILFCIHIIALLAGVVLLFTAVKEEYEGQTYLSPEKIPVATVPQSLGVSLATNRVIIATKDTTLIYEIMTIF